MNTQTEISQVLDRLHLGVHSGDGSGINRTHWLSFVDFIINNPADNKKLLKHKLISVLCIKDRSVEEYINCALAWGVLVIEDTSIKYNKTYTESVDNESTGNPDIDEAIRQCDVDLKRGT